MDITEGIEGTKRAWMKISNKLKCCHPPSISRPAYQDEDRVIPDRRISDLVWGSSPRAISDLWFEAADEAPPMRSVHLEV
ncbi:hypothetical protein RDI58_010681 [Solanum bulbocastanum]|uniref:Uncharacterized protein n=1 Tax=Solanum bulbocastanum TaxID=147425 RepID=A0AAN8TPQ8_SOLBU